MIDIGHALRVQVFRRRCLQVLNALEEFDAGRWLAGSDLFQVIERPKGLTSFS